MEKSSPSGIYETLLTFQEADVLSRIVGEVKPAVAVEIGSWAGGSSNIIVGAGAGYLFCVDPWEDYEDIAGFDFPHPIDYKATGFGSLSPDERLITFCDNVKSNLFSKIFPCRGTSKLWSSIWRHPIDFLFIDGCHSYESVKTDIEGWYPHVKIGGTILGHDYRKVSTDTGFIWEFPGVARAVHDSFKNFYVIPGTTFWMVIKGGTGDAKSGIGGLGGGGEMDGEIQESAHEGRS